MLFWAKGIKVQKAQFTIMNNLTEAKEFGKIKVAKYTNKDSPRRHTQKKHPQMRHADIVVAAFPSDNAWHMGRHRQNAVKLATSEWFAEAGNPGP